MATVKMLLSDSTLSNIPEQITRINDTKLSGFHARVGKPTNTNKTARVALYLNFRLVALRANSVTTILATTVNEI